MSLHANPNTGSGLDSFPRRRPYDGENEVLATDIGPGSVLRVIREPDHVDCLERACTDVVVLDVRESWIDVVYIDPGNPKVHGQADSMTLADTGLKPYEAPGGEYWNRTHHTQTLGARILTYLPDAEVAAKVKGNLNDITELQERYNASPAELPIESVALDALLTYAINGKTAPLFRHDLKPVIR